MAILFVLCKVVEIILSVTTTCMLLRAILPIFIDVEGRSFFAVIVVITEFFILPVRGILYQLNIGQDSMLDVPFFVTYLLLVVAQSFLPAIG